MANIRTFHDLHVWKKAHELVLLIYKITATFPKHELYGLVSQMRRAAVSVASNIVEGFQRRTIGEGSRFYNISDASLEELKYQLFLSLDLGYLSQEIYKAAIQLSEEVGKMLNGWANSQKKNARRA